ncbi:MAG TPA: hypothetical protein VKZ54_04070 [Membranihabitans sp.]|nr:hypothetical protein [Membranihabitans sp.]
MSTGKFRDSILGKMTTTERWTYLLLTVVCVVAIFLSIGDESVFNERFANEDGIVENMTTLALLGVAIVSGLRLVRMWKHRKWMWLAGTGLFIVMFFFAAGEEISWGQRIFGWETNEYFMEKNAQEETNIHNLVVGETKLNKLIFSQLLGLFTALYLIVLPYLYRKVGWIQKTIDAWGIPVAQWHHTLVFALITVVILLITADRKWEVYELGFGLIFFLIFINPFNRAAFK